MDISEKQAHTIVGNVKKVAREKNIGHLSRNAYEFITLKMGFIAHYNLAGFQQEYQDLRDFFRRLQTSEYSNDTDYNLRGADRQETDNDFRKWYGHENQKNTAWVIREIVRIARQHEEEVEEYFRKRQMTKELSAARTLALKYGYQVVKK